MSSLGVGDAGEFVGDDGGRVGEAGQGSMRVLYMMEILGSWGMEKASANL